METSLGRIFNAMGVPDWEEVFPDAICNKCPMQPQCPPDKRCAALTIIGGLGVNATIDYNGIGAESYVENIKRVLGQITKA